ILQVGNAVHDDFDGDGDLLFDLFGGTAGPLGDDLDVVVGYVGIGLDGEVVERDCAPHQQQKRGKGDEEAVIESVIEEGANHRATRYCSTVFCRTRAFVTTRSPGLIPETISCRLGGTIWRATIPTRRNRPFSAGT